MGLVSRSLMPDCRFGAWFGGVGIGGAGWWVFVAVWRCGAAGIGIVVLVVGAGVGVGGLLVWFGRWSRLPRCLIRIGVPANTARDNVVVRVGTGVAAVESSTVLRLADRVVLFPASTEGNLSW